MGKKTYLRSLQKEAGELYSEWKKTANKTNLYGCREKLLKLKKFKTSKKLSWNQLNLGEHSIFISEAINHHFPVNHNGTKKQKPAFKKMHHAKTKQVTNFAAVAG